MPSFNTGDEVRLELGAHFTLQGTVLECTEVPIEGMCEETIESLRVSSYDFDGRVLQLTRVTHQQDWSMMAHNYEDPVAVYLA